MAFPSHVFRFVAAATVALACSAVVAQPLPGGAQLGMSVAELRALVPALVAVPHPARLAGGLVGHWSGPAVDVGGVALVPTFFFARGEMQRVEYLGASRDGFEALLRWGRAQWGAELANQDADSVSASWSAGDLDVHLQSSAGRPPRLILRRRVLKDAGEL